ncbi:MAG: hypothetical protein WBA93_24470 [Microcoleaceae cyanobacterium]
MLSLLMIKGVNTIFVEGIKRGKIIELLEKVNLPDNQEILIEIKEVDGFWSAHQK